MEESCQDFKIGSNINTLDDCLKKFGKPHLLRELDMELELIRRNKEPLTAQENFLLRLKAVDKDILKQSRIHHPDKAIGENKLDGEVTNAHNMQAVLNATRTALKALTDEFLKDMDVHYKYEFFAKLNINILSSEKQIKLEINKVLCKISRLSEVKRLNIIGEIRKFLQKCQSCLESFHRNDKYNFVKYRDNALHHLHNCIEGYEELVREFDLIADEEEDENMRRVIQKMRKQSVGESKILQDLEKTAERSLNGNFEIFSIYDSRYFMESFLQNNDEYFVSPFTLYVDVLLMCSVIVGEKTGMKKKIKNFFDNLTIDYIMGPIEIGIKVPIEPNIMNPILEAYYLTSYFNNKNHFEEKVEAILRRQHRYVSDKDIKLTFTETVFKIEQFLAIKFDVDFYKEGKSDWNQFHERFFELNDSMAKFNEGKKDLLEKFKLYEQETEEILKEFHNLDENIEKKESQDLKNISKCHNKKENVDEIIFNRNKNHEIESYDSVGMETYSETDTVNIKNYQEKDEEHLGKCEENSNLPNLLQTPLVHFSRFNNRGENFIRDKYSKGDAEKNPSSPKEMSEEVLQIISGSGTNQTTGIAFNRYQNIAQGHSKNSKVDAEENPRSPKAMSQKVQQFISGGGTNRTTRIIFNSQEFSQGHNKYSKVDSEEISNFKRAARKEIPQNTKVKTDPFPDCISGNGTANQVTQMVYNPYWDAEEIPHSSE